MVTVADLQQLTDSWIERLGNPTQPSSYKDALRECIYEVTNLIDKSVKEELSYQEFLSSEADKYFSNLEPEDYATAI